jgi:predicted deacylase
MNQNSAPVLAPRSRVTTTIDFDRDGKQAGFLSVPISTHESAYGRIQIPIVSVRNGKGPTALLVAGSHGDEYEGQIALTRLSRQLQPSSISGCVIILPAANLPAALVGRRTSPLDEGNLNRAFPGDPNGSPTAMIAHYVESVLLPKADFAIDLHSGGSSLDYLPCAIVRDSGATSDVARTFAALKAFGGRFAYVTDGRNQGAENTFHAAASRCGVLAITTELGGAGQISAAGLRLAEDGTRRLLLHVGILKDDIAGSNGTMRIMSVEGPQAYVVAPEAGIFEASVELGQEVTSGECAGQIHFPDTPWKASVPVNFGSGGFIICRRPVALVRRGDCLFQVLVDYNARART